MATTVNHTDLTPAGDRIPVTVLTIVGGTDTNQAAAKTEYPGATTVNRVAVDLRAVRFARLSANVGSVAAVSGAYIQAEYSLDAGSTWLFLNGLLTTSGGPKVLTDTASVTVTSPWVAIAANAQKEVLVRLVSTGGDGAADPVFGTVALQVSK